MFNLKLYKIINSIFYLRSKRRADKMPSHNDRKSRGADFRSSPFGKLLGIRASSVGPLKNYQTRNSKYRPNFTTEYKSLYFVKLYDSSGIRKRLICFIVPKDQEVEILCLTPTVWARKTMTWEACLYPEICMRISEGCAHILTPLLLPVFSYELGLDHFNVIHPSIIKPACPSACLARARRKRQTNRSKQTSN